jgi:predicted phosphodiesterase
MELRAKALATLVLIIVASGTAIFLFAFQSTRNNPVVLVEGGYITSQDSELVTIRAMGLDANITLVWENDLGVGSFVINITNIDVAKAEIISEADVATIANGTSFEVLDVSTSEDVALVQIRTPYVENTISFYVLGDSQGYQGGIEQVVAAANENRPDFVFHCGDLGGERYLQHFGSSTYSFDFGPSHFAVFNTSNGDVSEDEIQWLTEDLTESRAERKYVFTHIPPFDPRSEGSHSMINQTTAERIMGIFEDSGVDTVFTGHIHLFNNSVVEGVRYVITGGAGASLYAAPEDGGIYHYVNVTIVGSLQTIEAVTLDSPSVERDMILVRGIDEDVTLSLDDLLAMPITEGISSFQNQYDNWRGQGTYRGVQLSDLLNLVGGMTVSDRLRVTSNDGYEQYFSYWNVYPNASWQSIQGDMILAFAFNGSLVPEWSDGMRLAMMPSDEGYSNDDCQATSAPGMGWHVYPSAGSRWVRYVETIEVVSG